MSACSVGHFLVFQFFSGSRRALPEVLQVNQLQIEAFFALTALIPPQIARHENGR